MGLFVLELFVHFENKSFIRHVFCKFFLPLCGLSFHFLKKVFNRVKHVILLSPHCYFSFVDMLLVLGVKTHHQTQGCVDFSLRFLVEFFLILHFKFVYE